MTRVDLPGMLPNEHPLRVLARWCDTTGRNDLNPSAVKQSINKLRSNREFIPLSTSALACSRADWLYGINLTRAYTLQGQK
jgi:hypothetical protein